jgi:RNA polymerase sigma factor (sigma-70 family)
VNFLRDGTSLRQLATLFNEGVTDTLADGQLLEQFATRRGETSERAFAILVERHGSVVMRLCRSVLRDEHDAQDAFQATFLVLARRADSLWVRDSLGPWLYSVAYRVAACARAAAIRRRRHEQRHAELSAGRLAVYQNDAQADVEAVVHEEIDRLPERYRAPLVLCDLEGCSHEQAARHLGLPIGTVKSRQARGRERLQTRLKRRGLGPSAALLPGGALTPALQVPAALTRATVNLAKIWAGADAARIAVLANEVLRVMFLQKLKLFVLPLALLALAAAGAGSLLWRATAAVTKERQANVATPVGKEAAAVANREPTGKIYITVDRADSQSIRGIGRRLMALDPNTGERTDIFDDCSIRPRVSPDGRTVAFERRNVLWVRGLEPNAKPRGIFVAVGGDIAASPPVWSPDGKQLVIGTGHHVEQHSIYTTTRISIDGSRREELSVPPEDMVQDWSPDGRWLLTASQRDAKIGWQLDVMRPDGTERRRITDGGNPFAGRFSPDGRRVLFFDPARGKQSGIWVIDFDGKNGRAVFPVDQRTNASACWSPDGQAIAITLTNVYPSAAGVSRPVRVVVMDLDGGHRHEFDVPNGGMSDMPDWR